MKNRNNKKFFKQKTAAHPLIILLALLLLAQPTIAEASTIEIGATRNYEKTAGTENFVNVYLNLSITENITGLIITEQIPADFKLVNSTSVPPASAVRINVTTNEVKWLFISLEHEKEITLEYTLDPPTDLNKNSYTIEGNWKAVSTETEATGLLPTTEIQKETTTIPTYLIVGIGAIIVAVAVITVMLAKRHSLTRS